jgi:hypothetical protein
MIKLAIIVLTIFMFLTGQGFSGVNTNIPFTDNFESYTNGTPLDTGTNGWYASSSNVIVTSNSTIAPIGSIKMAMIPVDSTLSNRFEGVTNNFIGVQMDLRMVFYDGTNNPVVDTNVVAMFYVNSNGYFTVHNGPATNPSPTNSLNWITITNIGMGTNNNSWTTISIHENFITKKWSLFMNDTLVTNNLGFINPNLTNFMGFNIYNGATTTYLDNVYIVDLTIVDVKLAGFPVKNLYGAPESLIIKLLNK